MERFTISLSESLAAQFDELIHKKGYQNRSEAVRDMVRDLLRAEQLEGDKSVHCVASLSYVYDHHARDLAERLTELQHRHHHLVLSAMHVHLDHDNCLETMILKGTVAAVRGFADRVQGERGVRHGQLNLVPVQSSDAHAGDGPHRHHGHLHLIPLS